MLNRRRFIGVVSLGGIATLFASLRVLQFDSPLVKSLEFKTLTHRHANIMASVFQSILALETSDEIKKTLVRADGVLSKFDHSSRFELMGALEILEQSPLWQMGSLKKFSNLTQSEQINILKRWAIGPKFGRALSQGLKEFSVFCYYSQDSTWSEIGYSGPLVKR